MIRRDDNNVWAQLASGSVEETPDAVREHLDHYVPGEFDLTLDLLPGDQPAFKARLQILGVIREATGVGDTYKVAAEAAFVAAARLFGVYHRA